MKTEQSDAKLFAVLARAAEQRVGEFQPQGLSNMAWAFAMGSWSDDNLFAALVRTTERLLCEFNGQGLANTLWAFAMEN